MARYDAVLLDVDGTLVASNDAHARAWVQVLRDDGFEVDPERVRRLIGKGGELLIEDLTGIGPEHPRNRRLRDARRALFQERYLFEVGAFPRVRELVDRIRAQGLGLVVATSSSKDNLRPLLARAGLEDLMEVATTSDDAEDPKPCPDIVEAAVEKAGVAADRAALIGDTPWDVEAAERAGVDVIAVRSGGWDAESLSGAVAVYDDVADVLDRWDGSPLGQ